MFWGSYQSIGIATSSAGNLATEASGPGHGLIAKDEVRETERERGVVGGLFGVSRARLQA